MVAAVWEFRGMVRLERLRLMEGMEGLVLRVRVVRDFFIGRF